MKLIRTFFLLLIAMLICVAFNTRAETKAQSVAIKDPTAIYTAGQFQVEGLAFGASDDLKEFDSGGGLAVTYWNWENVGLGFEGKATDTRHALFDTIGLNLAARAPVGLLKVAAIGRIGFDWQAEQVNPRRADPFDVYASVGLEKRFADYNLGAELRGVRSATLKPDEELQFIVRVGKTF